MLAQTLAAASRQLQQALATARLSPFASASSATPAAGRFGLTRRRRLAGRASNLTDPTDQEGRHQNDQQRPGPRKVAGPVPDKRGALLQTPRRKPTICVPRILTHQKNLRTRAVRIAYQISSAECFKHVPKEMLMNGECDSDWHAP